MSLGTDQGGTVEVLPPLTCVRGGFLFTRQEETDMRQYVVDAFTKEVFAGNPAAVCYLDRWPADISVSGWIGRNMI